MHDLEVYLVAELELTLPDLAAGHAPSFGWRRACWSSWPHAAPTWQPQMHACWQRCTAAQQDSARGHRGCADTSSRPVQASGCRALGSLAPHASAAGSAGTLCPAG